MAKQPKPKSAKEAPSAIEQRKEAVEQPAQIVAWKGFNKNLQCRDYQFEVGKTYTHTGTVAACRGGFHACENPDVWSYYGLQDGNRFCRVILSGKTDRHEQDGKIAAEIITIETEVTLGEMIKAGIATTIEATRGKGDDPSGYNARIGASGYNARIGASGDYARIDVTGANSIAASVGAGGMVKAPAGTPIAIAEYDCNGKPLRFLTAIVGEDGIKPDTFYRAENGKLVEA